MDLASLQIGDQLGRGAMGVVYRAFDPASQRQVALKVLLAGSADRFQREGVLSARFDHPNLVRVHASGVREGRPCLVYELIEGGKTLNDLMTSGCSLEEGVRILRDAARGLGHAHARGVLHRDVKPDNILIDAEGRGKVADFGLAASKGLDQLTVTGTVLGTPLYMAPETLGGVKEQVGPPTDVWALGAILFELLAGTPPFAGDSLVTLGVQVVRAPLPPIESARQAPPALLAVAQRALQKDPAARYPTGDAFADDLDAFLAGQLAAPSRSRAPLLFLALLALILVALAWAGLALSRAPKPTPSATPSPASSPPTAPRARFTQQELNALLRLPDPLDRYLGLRGWLAAGPADRAQRRSVLRALRRCLTKPLRTGQVGPTSERVVASFAPEGRILAAAQRAGSVSSWIEGRLEWSTEGSERAGTLGLPNGEALWWTLPPLGLRPFGPLGAQAPALSSDTRQVRYVAASPDSKRLGLIALGPNRLVILAWPEGSLEQRVLLPAPPHTLVFDRRGRIWVGVGRSVANTFTTLDAEVLVIGVASGRIELRGDVCSLGAPLSLALDPLSDEIILGLSTGDMVRVSPQAEKVESIPAFKEGNVLKRTFPAGVKAQVFSRAGDRAWIALNSLETKSALIELDWKAKRQLREVSLLEETESLVLSADEALLLRGTRSGKWELWGTGE